jgi:cysteine desulfurase
MSQGTTIYLDNAATTRVAPRVAEVVAACMLDDYGNPSSAHRYGIAAERRLKTARSQILRALGDPHGDRGQLYWTSGGTEADALAVLGAARARAGQGRHLVCSAIEHPAVLESMALLERDGWRTTRVPVTAEGVIEVDRLASAIEPDATTVVALMLVNNELGTVLPVADAARAARQVRPDIHVHCDAVQALGKVAIDVSALAVDSLALSSHKLHGPKGVGALWVDKSARLRPLWAGGGQQHGLRSGTENVPGIAGFGAAVELATADLDQLRARWRACTARMLELLEAAGTAAQVNCARAERAPHIVSLRFAAVPSEPLLHALERRGVIVAAGSACATNKPRAHSHVLHAIGLARDVGTLRVSFSRDTTVDDVERATKVLIDVLGQF